MLDVNDFIADRGGNPEKIRDSQRRRHASVEIVDEVIALFDDHRKSALIYDAPRFALPVLMASLDLYDEQPNTARPRSTARSTMSRSWLGQRRR